MLYLNLASSVLGKLGVLLPLVCHTHLLVQALIRKVDIVATLFSSSSANSYAVKPAFGMS